MAPEQTSTRLMMLRQLLNDLAVPGDVSEAIVACVRARSPLRLDMPMRPRPRPSLAEVARGVYKSSRSRSRILGSDLCPDPAWHMLVDLFAAGQEGRSVSVTSLCLASGVAPSTGLRHLNLAADGGLIARVPDGRDGRRILVGMTEKGDERVGAIIADVRDMLEPAARA